MSSLKNENNKGYEEQRNVEAWRRLNKDLFKEEKKKMVGYGKKGDPDEQRSKEREKRRAKAAQCGDGTAELAILTGMRLHRLPSHLGSRYDILLRYGISP